MTNGNCVLYNVENIEESKKEYSLSFTYSNTAYTNFGALPKPYWP